jgi:hypothetical protein
MAIVLIFPALMLLTLAGVAVLALDKPIIEAEMAHVQTETSESDFELAA